jgi:hypothetical protein
MTYCNVSHWKSERGATPWGDNGAETEMRGLLIVTLGVIVVVYVSSQIQTVAPWARDFCGLAGSACENQRWLLIAAASTMLVFALVRAKD